MPLPSLRQADTPRRRRGVQITPVGRRSLHSPTNIRCLDRIPTGTLSKKAASCPPPSISETCGVGRRLVMSRYTNSLTQESAMFLDKHSSAYLGGATEFILSPMLTDGFKDLAAAVKKGG